MANDILLTGEVLQQKWTRFADMAGVPEDERLKLSNGWLTRFKERNNLRQLKQHGEAASANIESVEEERQLIQKIIKEGQYSLRDLHNMDETGLFYGFVL